MASVAKRKWTYNGVEKEAWTVRYKDAAGKHRQRTFERKKEADKYRMRVMNELEAGEHIPRAEHRTFSAVCESFVASMNEQVGSRELRPGTVRERIYRLDRHVLPEFGERLVPEITSDLMLSWYRRLVASGLAPSTGCNYLALTGQVLQFAVAKKWLKYNPTKDAFKGITLRRQRVETFEPDEVRGLLIHAKDRPPRMRERGRAMLECAVNLAAFCGLRWGEIFGLTTENLDLETGHIQVRHSLDGLKVLQPPKTEAGERDIYAPAHVLELLRRYVAAYPSMDPDGVVFTSTTRAPNGKGVYPRPSTKAGQLGIRRSNIAHASRVDTHSFHESYWKPLLLRAGFLPVGKTRKTWRHFHALRHFAASWMLDSGWTLPEVQYQLGHSNPAMTLRVYSHVIKSKAQTAAAAQGLAHRFLQLPAPALVPMCNA